MIGRQMTSEIRGYFSVLSLAVMLVALTPSRASAHVTQVVVTRVESPTFGGVALGSVGQYEKVVGRGTGEVQPSDPRNAMMTYIMLAPRNARGMVEDAMDFRILRPIDSSRGNHRVFYEISTCTVALPYAPSWQEHGAQL
jgi:hypothetical protein